MLVLLMQARYHRAYRIAKTLHAVVSTHLVTAARRSRPSATPTSSTALPAAGVRGLRRVLLTAETTGNAVDVAASAMLVDSMHMTARSM
jgi:hypothetical protein